MAGVDIRRLPSLRRVLIVGGAQRDQGLGQTFEQRLELRQAPTVGVVDGRSKPVGD
jgi:hypothetical protein